MKVTLVPEQIVVSDALTAIEGATVDVTVIVVVLEVAVAGLAQARPDVITQ